MSGSSLKSSHSKSRRDSILKSIGRFAILDTTLTASLSKYLIFDVLIPANDQISHQILKNKISAEVKQISDEYHCVIEIDHAFV